MNFFFYISSYYLLIFSIIGFGFFFQRIILNEIDIRKINIGFIGIYGIFLLTLSSYISIIFIPHTYNFNLILMSLGLIFFVKFLKKYFFLNKYNFFYLLIISIIFILFIIGAKNHDDFPYYHFPYIHWLTKENVLTGIGHFNHGFRTHSSIFFLSSLFNLPFTNYFLVHLSPVFFMIFCNLILLNKIQKLLFESSKKKILIFSLFTFAFINIFFYRMGEHGVDRTAQILILIIFLIIFENFLFKFKKINNLDIANFFIIISITITLKTIYVLYVILSLIIFFNCLEKKKLIRHILTQKYFYFCTILVLFYFLVNFLNSGCVIYPLSITCFDNLSWTIPLQEVDMMNLWYEQWAKAGANPNFRVENPEIYVSKLNWLSNWLDMYFFNKVSDFILGLTLLLLFFYYIFKGKKITNPRESRKNIYILIFFVFLFLIEWFLKHPALRYGGYHLFALIFILYFIIFFENHFKFNKKNIIIWISIVFVIFFSRNAFRIYKETKQYNLNVANVSYNKDFKNVKVYERMKILMNCKDKEYVCRNDNIFFENQKFMRKKKGFK